MKWTGHKFRESRIDEVNATKLNNWVEKRRILELVFTLVDTHLAGFQGYAMAMIKGFLDNTNAKIVSLISCTS